MILWLYYSLGSSDDCVVDAYLLKVYEAKTSEP